MKNFVWTQALLLSFITNQIVAQFGSGALLHAIQNLSVNASVMYIAAHPDDENTRLIAWLANEKHYRTAYLSLTRGDGGQNLIGSEQGPLLGLIRTNELLEARHIDGGIQYFTRANDFGYSKTPEETLKKWQKDSILSDVVFAIRKFKPDVIICRFPTTGEGGHGHHTASAILAEEAFKAAADPSRFSWQLRFCEVWQAKRLFWNTFNFGGTNTTSPDQLKIDVGGFNAVLGKSYGEIASASRTCHKSQGFGTAPQRGSQMEYFKQLAGPPTNSDILEGVVLNWSRFKQDKLDKQVQKILSQFDPLNPEKSLTDLQSFYSTLKSISSTEPLFLHYQQLKIKQCEDLILKCAGFYVEASISDAQLVPQETYTVTAKFINRGTSAITLNSVEWPGSDTLVNVTLLPQQPLVLSHRMKIQEETPYTTPYWLEESYTESLYQVKEVALLNAAERKSVFTIGYTLLVNKTTLTPSEEILFRSTDPVKGEKMRRPIVVPSVSVKILDKCAIFNQGDTRVIKVQLKSNLANVTGKLVAAAPLGFSITLPTSTVTLDRKNQEITLPVTVTAQQANLSGELRIRFIVNGKACALAQYNIEYDHIPAQVIQRESICKLVGGDLKGNSVKIAYIVGAGDEVAEGLIMSGYDVTILSGTQLEREELARYKAIITGVRAYNVNEKLQSLNEKLLEYVNNGGNLIVQYNTNSRIGPLNARMGPYPFKVSRDRVTDELAPVIFKHPLHAALTYPNILSGSDFENWIQERGIYYASEIDERYATPLEMNDPGEATHKGSLIIAAYGKGHFVYTGLAFFRQIPNGHLGAMRLMSNLIHLKQ